MIILTISFAVRRFHDLNRSGYACWSLVVPIYNIYIHGLLLFKKGTDDTNPFGADPTQDDIPQEPVA
jgi:uncharacterized membrane protein YhaH (DUF805 family)